MVATELSTQSKANEPSLLTVERAAYGAVLLLALVMRFIQLDAYPLSTEEISHALAAWDAVQGRSVDLSGLSPLLFSLQEITFFVTGGGDLWARWWPAWLGALMCLLPYGLRSRLGREGAILAALALATSPTLIYFSRHGTGDIIAGAALLALLSAISLPQSSSRRALWIGMAAGLGIISGPVWYTGLLAGIVAWALLRRKQAADALRIDGAQLRAISGAAAITAVLIGTGLLSHWEGIGAAFDLLGTWAQRLTPSTVSYPIYWPILRLILDEPLLVALGMYGAWRAWRREDREGQMLTAWAGIALAWTIVTPGRQPQDLIVVVIPLALLAGRELGRILPRLDLRAARWEALAVIGALSTLMGTAYVWASGYGLLGQATHLIALVAPVGLIISTTLMSVWWLGWPLTRQILVIFALLSGSLWTFSAGWINSHGTDRWRRVAVQFEMTAQEVKELPAFMERLSEQRVGDPYLLAIDLVDSPEVPILRWYLRRWPVRVVGAPRGEQRAPVVITPLGEDLVPGEAYRGQRLRVREWWLPEGMQPSQWLRWLLVRQSVIEPAVSEVILWVEVEKPIAETPGA
ncbi:MAG: hypothetical protein Kow0047_27930 [Anaerolineae bacterium]